MYKEEPPITTLLFSQEIFEKKVQKDHLLYRIDQEIDFSFVNEECRDMYSPDRGRRVVNFPERMFRAEIIQYMYNLSDRYLRRKVNENIAYMWFVGYNLDDKVFHWTAPGKFRIALGEEKHKKLFDYIIEQLIEKGLIKKNENQSIDATHILGDVAIQSTTGVVKQAVKKLIVTVQRRAKTLLPRIAEEIDMDYYIRKKGKKEYKMDAEEKRKTLNRVADDALKAMWIVELALEKKELDLKPKHEKQLQEAIDDIKKIFGDYLEEAPNGKKENRDDEDAGSGPGKREEPGPGTEEEESKEPEPEAKEVEGKEPEPEAKEVEGKEPEPEAREVEGKEPEPEAKDGKSNEPELKYVKRKDKGKDRIVSTVDRDVRWGAKSDDKTFAGYKSHSTMTDGGFVTNTEVTPGGVIDDKPALPLAEHQKERHGILPKKMRGDGAYGTVENRKGFKEMGIQLVAPEKTSHDKGEFPKDRFIFDDKNWTMVCPAGEMTGVHYYNKGTKSNVYHFNKGQCGPCEYKKKCTKRDFRTISIHEDYAIQEEAKEYNRTEAYKEDRKIRSHIEPKQGEMKRFHGLVRAKYRGLARVNIQAIYTAIVVNLKRMVAVLPSVSSRPKPAG